MPIFEGTEGSDTFNGSHYGDRMNGYGGDDVFHVTPTPKWHNYVDGGGGSDLVTLPGLVSDYQYSLLEDGSLRIVRGTVTPMYIYVTGVESFQFDESGAFTTTELLRQFGTNLIQGTDGADFLSGTDGRDLMEGGVGRDVFLSSLGNDRIIGDFYAPWLNPPKDYDQVDYYGSIDDYTFTQNADGSVTVSGAATGTDTLFGIEGFYFYGTKTWYSMEDALKPNVIDGTPDSETLLGTHRHDMIFGQAGNDIIDGGAGADKMDGWTGDDTYVVDNTGDMIYEHFDRVGIDTVRASISFSLADRDHVIGSVENLTLLGTANINGLGNSLANILIGNTAANQLNGGGGADILRGGFGADTYTVDNAGDRVDERDAIGDQSIDLVRSTVSFSLTTQALGSIENVTLLGIANISALGNSLANVLIGNSGANQLNGGGGADILRGGLGSDTYTVDNIGDQIDERDVMGDPGVDLVRSTVSVSLVNTAQVRGQIENVTLLGYDNIDATGNDLNNVLVGNAGANLISGGLGADKLTGGAGDDVFLFGRGSGTSGVDAITDMNEQGNDTIELNGSVFSTLRVSGALAASAFHIGTGPADADDRIVYNSTSGELFYDANGNAAGGSMLFAILDPGLALTAADFYVGWW